MYLLCDVIRMPQTCGTQESAVMAIMTFFYSMYYDNLRAMKKKSTYTPEKGGGTGTWEGYFLGL